jgi:hypothetical protein
MIRTKTTFAIIALAVTCLIGCQMRPQSPERSATITSERETLANWSRLLKVAQEQGDEAEVMRIRNAMALMKKDLKSESRTPSRSGQ